MNFRQKAKLLFNNSAWDDFIRSFLRGDDLPMINGQIPINSTTAMTYTAVFACVRVLSETLAGMPIMLYQKNPKGDRESKTDLRIYDILHNAPNSEMSPFNFKEACMIALNTGGNTVCERIVNPMGELIGLYPYPWSMVSIDRDKGNNQLVYKIKGETTQRSLTRAQVFHIPGMSIDGVIGLSPIEYATSAIRLGLSYEQFGIAFYKNGMNPSIALEYPAELSDGAFNRLKEDITKNYAGTQNTGKPLILEGGAKAHELTMKPADAQLIENKRFQIEDIARMYRVPMHLIQDLTRSTNNNIEHQSLEFVMYTMLPWFKRWEEAINMQLLTLDQRRAGYYAEFKLDSLLRGDSQSRAQAYATGRQWGWLSVNDIRRLENMNPIPNGDIYLQPSNMFEAGKEQPAATNAAYNKMVEDIFAMIKEKGGV